MSVVESLERLGGVATRAALIAATDRIRVDRALEAGDVIVLARGDSGQDPERLLAFPALR
jgi:hypothetical protein